MEMMGDQTNPMKRWYCTLKQRQTRHVRKTLLCSKSDAIDHIVTKWCVVDRNLAMKNQDISSFMTITQISHGRGCYPQKAYIFHETFEKILP